MTKDSNSGDKTGKHLAEGNLKSSEVGTRTNSGRAKERAPKRRASAQEHEAFARQFGAELIVKPWPQK